LLDQAGLAEAGGSHHEHQRLASGLDPSEQGSTLHPAVGQGTAISWRWDRHALFGPGETARRAT